jgi:hypothetical protein
MTVPSINNPIIRLIQVSMLIAMDVDVHLFYRTETRCFMFG